MIVVIDCGIGNLQSVLRGLEKAVAATAVIASSAIEDVTAAERIVLPGVGSFGQGMENLVGGGLLPVLTQKVQEQKTPLLGICLGHQMLTSGSDEGSVAGLGWIDGKTTRLPPAAEHGPIKIPHMGWNTLNVHNNCALLHGIPDDACFYFAHSYAMAYDGQGSVIATTDYGDPFVSIVQNQNIFGVQFHPEKSHANGITILRNFLSYQV